MSAHVIVSSVIPACFAASYMRSSTSEDTAFVQSVLLCCEMPTPGRTRLLLTIEYSELRFVIKHPGEAYSLLLPAGEDVFPLLPGVKSAFSARKVC